MAGHVYRTVPVTSRLRSFNRDFDAIVNVYGDRPVLVPVLEGRPTITFENLDELVGRHLAWFEELGLQPGSRLGVLLPNSTEMLVLFTACLRAGLGIAPLACDTSSTEALSWLQLIQPSVVVVGDIVTDNTRNDLVAAGATTVEVANDGEFSHLPFRCAHSVAPGAKLYLYTSGTTGQPKAIVLDGDRLWSAGHAFVRQHGIGFDTPLRMWNYLPQSYLGGLFNLYLIPLSVAGSTVVDEGFSGKTFLSFWQSIDRFDVNALWLVPSIVAGLLTIGERTGRHHIKSYREAISVAFLGTAPIMLEEKRRFERLFGITLLENYGLSETTFISWESAGALGERSQGSVGRVAPGTDLRFRQVAEDEFSEYCEILVRTPFLFDGYLAMDGTVALDLEDGYFPTGDLGFIDSHGQLVINGRCKEVIKKGGQLLSMRELEVVASRHPAVADVAAVPVPHPFYGESYELFLKLASGSPAAVLDDVKIFIYSQLSKYKWPEQIHRVDEFPATASGKIRKFLLSGTSADA